jgi:hypothetical protein
MCVSSVPQYQEGQKRRKPNYSSVDLSEVEWEDKDDFVRLNHDVTKQLTHTPVKLLLPLLYLKGYFGITSPESDELMDTIFMFLHPV